jgi:putative transposase
VSDLYSAVASVVHTGIGAVTEVCRFLEVSRSAFYAWRDRKQTFHERQEDILLPLVRIIFRRHRRRYGARRIADELRDMGHVCSAKRVAKLLQIQGLRAIQPKCFQPKTTDSKHRLGYSPNLLTEADEPHHLDELWVGDITYVPLTGGAFVYLALLMDRCSRRIVAWHIGEDMKEGLVLNALRKAIRGRHPRPGLIHHTDRGGQYAGIEYRKVLRRAGIRQSMSRADNCYDNAFTESCFGTLKRELEMTEYESHGDAKREIAEFIQYYNYDRKHSALEYLKPAQFESLITSPK